MDQAMTPDRETKKWLRTIADERAADAGMRFDLERGEFACQWIENHCCLYEGDLAGEPLILLPFQRDFIMRLFGWVRWSDEWGQWIRRFTHAAFWASKKQGKSPLAAAYNLYLLCGDGEQGQKVYMMAKDGNQAKIAQRHSVMMVKQSPALRDDCKINNTTLAIKHLPTSSIIDVVTGDDRRGADSKHGYNGSVTIDEMHVVSRPMMEAVGRAGISRKEPLQTSFSTAGTEPSSPGHERFQYGRQVNSGERNDLHFLHVEYCAPDKATDSEIEEHLEEYGKAANPAWGTLIKPSEFKADWERSKGSPRSVAIFKQERLNLWVGSTNAWLDSAGWEKGQREFTLEDLRGRDCYLGIDLSRTRDMTAASLLFPWPEDGEEVVRIWPLFWMPEDTAKERDHLFPFRSWAAGKHVALTPGGVVDYGKVKTQLREVVSGYTLNVIALYFDQHYAEEFTQNLADGDSDGPGFGCPRIAVPQSVTALSPLCKEFERRVSSGRIHHPGNPVMTWQVGHAEIWQDRNLNIRPSKPDPHSGKCIDGVAAAVDAMAGIVSNPEPDTPSISWM